MMSSRNRGRGVAQRARSDGDGEATTTASFFCRLRWRAGVLISRELLSFCSSCCSQPEPVIWKWQFPCRGADDGLKKKLIRAQDVNSIEEATSYPQAKYRSDGGSVPRIHHLSCACDKCADSFAAEYSRKQEERARRPRLQDIFFFKRNGGWNYDAQRQDGQRI